MFRVAHSLLAILLVAALTVPAAAGHRHHKHQGHHARAYDGHQHSGRAARVRYGGKHGRGYWRPGPKKGYGFGFATYRGDPFGGDDYWDKGRCYYVHHRNHCVGNRIFNGFWDD